MRQRSRSKTPLLAGLATLVVLVLATVLLLEDGFDSGSLAGQGREPAASLNDQGAELPAPFVAVPGLRAPDRVRQPVLREPPPRLGPQVIALAVTDLATGKPVPAFQVTALPAGPGDPLRRLEEGVPRPFQMRTGIVSFGADPGTYDVVVMAPSYLPATLRGVIVPALDGDPLPLGLSRGAGIAGHLYGSDGLARSNVNVFLEVLQLHESGAEPPRYTVVRTGMDGGFSFSPLASGQYAVTPLQPDNTLDRVAGVVVSGGSTQVEIHLVPRHQLAVQVRDERGLGVRSALVELRGPGQFYSATTTDSGRVLFENVDDGEYELNVTAAGHLPLSEPVSLSGGASNGIHFANLEPDLDQDG